jgi:hypothetical protein
MEAALEITPSRVRVDPDGMTARIARLEAIVEDNALVYHRSVRNLEDRVAAVQQEGTDRIAALCSELDQKCGRSARRSTSPESFRRPTRVCSPWGAPVDDRRRPELAGGARRRLEPLPFCRSHLSPRSSPTASRRPPRLAAVTR